MTNREFVLTGRAGHPAQQTLLLLTTIRREVVAIPAIHPGEQSAEELKELRMSAAELARHLDVPTNRVREILNGRKAITGDPALRMAHFFGLQPNYGSTCKAYTTYASHRRKRESRSTDYRH
jgi:addiction module HigA family antidote